MDLLKAMLFKFFLFYLSLSLFLDIKSLDQIRLLKLYLVLTNFPAGAAYKRAVYI